MNTLNDLLFRLGRLRALFFWTVFFDRDIHWMPIFHNSGDPLGKIMYSMRFFFQNKDRLIPFSLVKSPVLIKENAYWNELPISWPVWTETGIFGNNWASTMAVDALVPGITRSSATMSMQDTQFVHVFHEEGFQLPEPSLHWEIITNINIYSRVPL